MENSPYTPGAGHSPEVLAGRDQLLGSWRTTLSELQTSGRKRSVDLILSGPRGVGKTVTLTEFHKIGAESDFDSISLQAVSNRGSLVEALLYRADERIREEAGPWVRARHALERLGAINLGVAGFSAGVSVNAKATQPLPDAGVFAKALATLAFEISNDKKRGGLLVTIDELQVADGDDLALLAATLQRLNVDHSRAPVAFAATGLPNTPESLRRAGVTHPDRLFDIRPLPVDLDKPDARYAIAEPARRRLVTWEDRAIDLVLEASKGYPAHLQLLADQVWRAAPGPDTIRGTDADEGVVTGLIEIKRRTLEPRWVRASDRQRELLAAIAVNGGHTTARHIRQTLGRDQAEWSRMRDDLISEGDIYSPRRGEITLTIPSFAAYIVDNYEDSRDEATKPILSLAELVKNASLT